MDGGAPKMQDTSSEFAYSYIPTYPIHRRSASTDGNPNTADQIAMPSLPLASLFAFVALVTVATLLLLSSFVVTNGAFAEASSAGIGQLLVTQENSKTLASTDARNIRAIDVHDGYRGTYHLQFITMKPNTLFLPVLLHANAIIYVHSGSGRVLYFSEEDIDKTERIDV
ncbi:hypothetical protein Cni_G10505 [Canna indica]|uniref:Transmembrane protein n=1 Tax=Canna indica TaxID=4628 RepID=A0AAQ3K4C8_9LILI|nr:hypothetical protein Cni_G10505 [Canna indica]